MADASGSGTVKSSSRIFLISSLVLGLLAMLAAFAYLENTAGQERGPKAMVLVARHQLAQGNPIDPEKDLVEVEVPARMAELRSRALGPDFRKLYKGERINRNIPAGQPVMWADLAGAADIELRGESRALSIPVKGANALGGLLLPGAYVKLLVTRPLISDRGAATSPAGEGETLDVNPQAQRWETIPVGTTAFKVLAISGRGARSRLGITAADQYAAEGTTQQQTVTLEVTEPQARMILEQTGAGQLPVTLLLCPGPK